MKLKYPFRQQKAKIPHYSEIKSHFQLKSKALWFHFPFLNMAVLQNTSVWCWIILDSGVMIFLGTHYSTFIFTSLHAHHSTNIRYEKHQPQERKWETGSRKWTHSGHRCRLWGERWGSSTGRSLPPPHTCHLQQTHKHTHQYSCLHVSLCTTWKKRQTFKIFSERKGETIFSPLWCLKQHSPVPGKK